MAIECNDPSARRQRAICRQAHKAASQVDAMQFFNLLTSPELLDELEALLPEHRERKYPPTVALSMFLGQVLSTDGACQNAVNGAVVNRLLSGLPAESAATGAYCMARQRLPQPLVRELARRVAAGMDRRTPAQWRWRGRPVKLVDGSTTLMADTPANPSRFPQHGQQESGAGFPIARLVGVISLDHGAVLEVAMGPYQGKGTGEHGLFRPLKESFVAGDVMLADSYSASYFLIADLRARGVDFVFEQQGARKTDFRKGDKLGVRDHLVQWSRPVLPPKWMSEQEYQSFPLELTLREVKVGKKVLVTSLLRPREICKREIGRLFRMRWHVELDLRNIKTTLGMEKLSCKTPQMCEKELWVYLLAYNMIRLLMAQAASLAGILPRQLSFKPTVQVWLAWSGRQFLSDALEDTAALFGVIAQVRVGRRPGRLEPRAVKQRPKAFPRLQTSRRHARAIIRRCGRPQRLAA